MALGTEEGSGPLQAQASIIMSVWQSFLDAAESQQLSQQSATMQKRCIENIWNFVLQALHDEEAWFLVGTYPRLVMHDRHFVVHCICQT